MYLMKKVFVGIAILFRMFWPGAAYGATEIVLSITGEDVSHVVNQFNRSQSDYHLVVQRQTYRNWRYAINQFRYSQQSTAQRAGDRGIDIAFIDNNWLAGMIQNRWLADISGEIIQAGHFVNGLTKAATKGGKLYALPFSNKGQVLFFRRDLHDKYGLQVPRTLKELEQNARLLIEHEGLDHGMTIHCSAMHLDVLPFLWSNGGGIMKNGEVIVNHPSNIETLTYLQALARNGVLPGPEAFRLLKGTYSNAKKLFMEGKSGYIVTWNNRIAAFENTLPAGKFGIAKIPTFKAGQPSFSVIGSWYFAVNAFSTHKEGAIRFLNYFYKDQTQLELALKSNAFIPATKSVYAEPQLSSKNRYLHHLKSAMSNMRHRLEHTKEPQISHILENTIKEIIIEGKPVKELMDIAQKRIARIAVISNE
jgi:ABC-type glycerol-3-phosphate transport system substrate-binding protein